MISILFFEIGLITTKAQDEEVVVDEIIGKVDDYVILRSELEQAYLEYLSRGQFRSSDAKCHVFKSLVQQKMFLAQAVLDSVEVDDAIVQAELSARMEAITAEAGGSEEELEAYFGKSLQQIEDELFDDMKNQKIIQTMQGNLTQDLKVSPAEVKKFFNNIPADSLPYFSTEVMAAQIVVQPKAGKEQKDKVRSQLFDIKRRIEAGESFASLARQYSEDPGSAARGGELPFYGRGQLAPEFEATAMTLKEGQISDPVETDFGFHIIELMQRRGNTFKARHILMSPKASIEDIQGTENFLDSIRTAILMDSITFQQAAKDYSDDQYTASNGGFFKDAEGALRVSVDQLDPTIFFTLDTLTIGTITRPEQFQQADGSMAYRILYYKDKVPPHQANLKQDYQKIANAALSNKRNMKLNEYFETARKNVYIEIDPSFDYCNIE